MKKEELLRILKENAENVKNAEDTVKNIETKVVDNVKPAEGMPHNELPTQKEVEKAVEKNEGPMIPVDADGVSKNGGEDDRMQADKVEAERKKEDNGMKDVINVSTRKVEESDEINNELLRQLQEAAEREESYKEKINKINTLCEKALKAQADSLTKQHAEEVTKIFESVIVEGEKLERELTESAKKNERMYKVAKKLYESSNKLNKILLEAVKSSAPEKKMARVSSASYRAVKSLSK
jgi:hypothetical protein